MPIQKRLVQAGLARQTAGKGTPISNATFGFGVQGGRVVEAPVSENDLSLTWPGRQLEGHERTAVKPGATFDTVGLPQMIGLLLLGACGADAVTGSSAPYTHTITPFDTLPYLTMFGRTASNYLRVWDCKVDSLELVFDQLKALVVKPVLLGTTPEVLSSPWTITTAERVSGGYFGPGGTGTFQLEGVSANILSGSVKISNKTVPTQVAYQATPTDVFEGVAMCDISLKIQPDDINLWKKVVFGSAISSGSTASNFPYYGTGQLKWVLDANTDITWTAPRMKFMTDYPEASPDGGPVEIQLAGSAAAPASGSAFQFVLRNTVAAY